MLDLIDRNQLKAQITETFAESQDVRQIIGTIPPVTTEIICNVGSALAVSKMPADTTTYSCSIHDLVQELHNCPNCGGSVDAEGICRYCGSRVYKFGGI